MDEQPSSQTGADPSRPPLADVIARCREERNAYRLHRTAGSPGCAELFRRAFAQDQGAWQAIRITFEPLIRAWIGPQRKVEHDDVVQETFLAFARYAPAHPDLVAGDDLSRVLGFLRRCAKTALLTLLRKQPEDEDLEQHTALALPPDDVELRDALRARIAALSETEEERRVFYLRFECGMKPSQIVESYGRQFPDVAAVYDIVHRLTRRLRSDPALRDLAGLPPAARRKPASASSLEIRANEDDQDMPMPDKPCALSEEQLIDYATGAAPAELRRAVEQSPACVGAARRLAAEVLPLMRRLYRLNCPDPQTLVAYQERRLEGTQQLVVRAHVVNCALCREECAVLAAIDATPLDPVAGRERRLVEAIFQPLALLQPMRGEILHYQAPQMAISLSVRKARGRPRSWTLRGQVRTPDGLLVPGVEAVTLRPLDQLDMGEHQEMIESPGTFVFRGLPAGSYSLSVLTAEEEIIIRQLVVGDA